MYKLYIINFRILHIHVKQLTSIVSENWWNTVPIFFKHGNYIVTTKINLLHVSLLVISCHLLKCLFLFSSQFTPLDWDCLRPLSNLQCLAHVWNTMPNCQLGVSLVLCGKESNKHVSACNVVKLICNNCLCRVSEIKLHANFLNFSTISSSSLYTSMAETARHMLYFDLQNC